MARAVLREQRLHPIRLAVLYLVVGVLVLFATDPLFHAIFDTAVAETLQTATDAVLIAGTAGLIYLLVRANMQDLRLRERAIEAAPIGITVADAAAEDNPLVLVNRHFEELTGYPEADVLGRNCRFLQGEDTDPETRAALRRAIDEERSVSVDIVNYRQDDTRFWNKVDIAPIRDADGTVSHFVGFQTDITERKIRAERLDVLNRVLRHNFRNKMNVIIGYVEILREHVDEETHEAMERINQATADLLSLTDTVRRNENILEGSREDTDPVRLDERLSELAGSVRDRFPEATVTLDLAGPAVARAPGLLAAIEEAVENAIKHNEGPTPTVDVRVDMPTEGWVAIEIEDNGPGIPGPEVEVLAEGETPLQHADRLGIWSIYWTVIRAGGSMEISNPPDGGSVLSLRVPGGPVRAADSPGTEDA